MPMPDEWRIHAKATRNEAARATCRGETEYARVLLKLAEQMESQADTAAASPICVPTMVGSLPPSVRKRPCRISLIQCCTYLRTLTPANDRARPIEPLTDAGSGTVLLHPESNEVDPHAP